MVHFSFDFSKRNRADDIIDSLIEKVLAAYPAQRLERIKAQSEATWKGVDNGHNERISYVVLNCLPPEEPKTPGDATDIQR
ncbi:MAG: hypothetical protein FWH48_11605, partial [Oscillospiraceae bacterium]|nr:hypothetical protein [Oscillospiraceae bacterium]